MLLAWTRDQLDLGMVVGTPSWVKQGGGWGMALGELGDSRARGWGGQGCGYTGREARSCSCVEEVGGGEGGVLSQQGLSERP